MNDEAESSRAALRRDDSSPDRIDDMEDIAKGLRVDAVRGIDAADLQKTLDVLNRMKENLQALDGPGDDA